nr:hypothetical protein [Thermus parvatiensis]
MEGEAELWDFLEKHLKSIYDGDPEGYRATTPRGALPSTSGSSPPTA